MHGRKLSKLFTCPLSVLALAALLSIVTFPVQAETPRQSQTKIYIQPQDGFESFVSAAMIKKHVPAIVTQNKEDAQFVLASSVQAKTETTGSKVARCLLLYCAGMEGTQSATVQLVDSKTQEVAWAYNVKKPSASAYQSTAESIAKHLRQFLEKRR